MSYSSELPAGREIDLAITELMGWPVSKNFRKELGLDGWDKHQEWIDWRHDLSNYPYVNSDVSDRLIVFRQPEQNGETWSPSTSIADAWEVVEMMLRRHFYYEAHCGQDMHYCRIVGPQFREWTGVSAETASLAICRACLNCLKRST